jgi:hypothetical protein
MSLIIAKRKTSFFYYFSLSLPHTPCSAIADMYTRNSCAEEKKEKEKFKVRQRNQVEICIHLDVRWLFAQMERSFACLKKYNELIEGQTRYIGCEIALNRLILNKKKKKDLFLLHFLITKFHFVKNAQWNPSIVVLLWLWYGIFCSFKNNNYEEVKLNWNAFLVLFKRTT